MCQYIKTCLLDAFRNGKVTSKTMTYIVVYSFLCLEPAGVFILFIGFFIFPPPQKTFAYLMLDRGSGVML